VADVSVAAWTASGSGRSDRYGARYSWVIYVVTYPLVRLVCLDFLFVVVAFEGRSSALPHKPICLVDAVNTSGVDLALLVRVAGQVNRVLAHEVARRRITAVA
jgi:hypothetical protein